MIEDVADRLVWHSGDAADDDRVRAVTVSGGSSARRPVVLRDRRPPGLRRVDRPEGVDGDPVAEGMITRMAEYLDPADLAALLKGAP
jgi:hypothetical protein